MRKFDEQEEKIVKELIKNPRISDNKISKITQIPVMTVNRKRKKLEEKGYLNYFTVINTYEEGTSWFHAKQLYMIKFKIGLTPKQFIEKIEEDHKIKSFFSQHIEYSFLGEKDGHLALALILVAKTEPELMQIFNGMLIPFLKQKFGENAVKEVNTTTISKNMRLHHNYMPWNNMDGAKISEGFNDDWIFANITQDNLEEQKKILHFDEYEEEKGKD